jgi:hypothetical protein
MNHGQNKSKHTKKLTLLLLTLTIIATTITPQTTTAQTDGYYHKNYTWYYGGQHWSWNLSIPEQLYNTYKAIPISNRTHDGLSGYGYLTTTQDLYVQSLANQLNNSANQQGYGSFDKLSYTLAFVQSLPYTSDKVTTGNDEYPRFPLETLVDDGGDCEDTAILFATLTLIMGFDTVFINPPGHYAVGIHSDNLKGTHWTYPQGTNKTYYYCETTGSGFMIGELPYPYIGKSVNIYPINQTIQFNPLQYAQIIAIPPSTKAPQNTPDTDSAAQPSGEPIFPSLTINVLYDNPLLYVLSLFSAVITVSFAVGSIKRKTKNPKN